MIGNMTEGTEAIAKKGRLSTYNYLNMITL